MANEKAVLEPITDGELARFKDQINSVLLSRFIARVEADGARIRELTSANAQAELNGLAAEQRRIREIVESSDSYVPQDVAAACLLTLKPLDEPGKPNTLIALIERAMERIAELTRKGEDLCQFAGTMMLTARRVLGVDRAPYRPETGMDSFSPDAKVLYDLITHPSAAGYAEAITAKDQRIAELEADLDRLAGPDDARYCKGCGQALELCEQVQQRDNVGCCYACFHPLIANDNRVAELEAELLRLAGPPCDYPPCARKRAVEHALCNPHDEQIYLDQCTRKHPRWPEGEAWLRARSAK